MDAAVYTSDRNHSADVRVHLHVNGSVLRVGQIGDGRLLLQDAGPLEHDHGTVVMTIDNEEFRWDARFKRSDVPVREIKVELTPIQGKR